MHACVHMCVHVFYIYWVCGPETGKIEIPLPLFSLEHCFSRLQDLHLRPQSVSSDPKEQEKVRIGVSHGLLKLTGSDIDQSTMKVHPCWTLALSRIQRLDIALAHQSIDLVGSGWTSKEGPCSLRKDRALYNRPRY